MQTKQSQRLVIAAFIISTLLGANNAIAVRFSNVELPPFFAASTRFATASLLLFLIVLARRLPLPTGRSLVGALVFGALQFGFNYALLYWSLLTVPAGLLQVIMALVPLLTFALAILQHQQAFEWRLLVGGLVALGGIALVFFNHLSASAPLLPLLAIVLAAALIAEATVLFKTFPKTHPITTNAVAMLTGSTILFVMSMLWGETPRLPTLPATWLAVGYLIVFGSVVTFVLSLYVLSRWTATASSYQLVLMPIATVLFASWLANEAITVELIIGGVLVLAGVYIGAIASPNLLKRFSSRLFASPEDAPIPVQPALADDE